MKTFKPAIAVAGATGALGSRIASTLLSDGYRPKYSAIVLISRKKTPQLDKFEAQGAKIAILGDSSNQVDLAHALKGVLVLVNAINTKGKLLRDQLVSVLPVTDVRLYFPSEFGVDHTLHDFEMPEWDAKKEHLRLARELTAGTGIKVCRLFIGLFLEDGFEDWYGFGLRKSAAVYGCEAVGDVDAHVSYTSLDDVGKIISVLATQTNVEQVPESLRVSGSEGNMREIAISISKRVGKSLDLRTLNGNKFKEDTIEENSTDALRYLRFLMGDGSIDYRSKEEGGHGNDNEAVNPGEKWFKWKTWQEQVA